MKSRFFLFLLVFLSFSSCQELPPLVTGKDVIEDPPFDPPPAQRQVLLEEFTGVQCVVCPAGSADIEDLLAIHRDQLVAVSLHAGELSNPYPFSEYNFLTDEGNALEDYLGQPFGWPSAVINRKKFGNNFGLQLGRDDWAGYIEEELSKEPKLTIEIEPVLDLASRNLEIDLTLTIKETISSSDVRLSIMFTESHIKDHQITPQSSPGTQADYNHKHVLRGMATVYDGDPINEELIIGSELRKNYQFIVPTDWKTENCKVVAFVHLSGEEKDVLQAHQVDMIQ